jgi:hypothetical protein
VTCGSFAVAERPERTAQAILGPAAVRAVRSRTIEQLVNGSSPRRGRAEPSGDALGSFLAEGVAYIELALEPEVQRIMLLYVPAVLGDLAMAWTERLYVHNNCSAAELMGTRSVRPVDAGCSTIDQQGRRSTLYFGSRPLTIPALSSPSQLRHSTPLSPVFVSCALKASVRVDYLDRA